MDCTIFHCKYDACDLCKLDENICNGRDGDETGKYCRHMSEELVSASECALCALSQDGTACKMQGSPKRGGID